MRCQISHVDIPSRARKSSGGERKLEGNTNSCSNEERAFTGDSSLTSCPISLRQGTQLFVFFVLDFNLILFFFREAFSHTQQHNKIPFSFLCERFLGNHIEYLSLRDYYYFFTSRPMLMKRWKYFPPLDCNKMLRVVMLCLLCGQRSSYQKKTTFHNTHSNLKFKGQPYKSVFFRCGVSPFHTFCPFARRVNTKSWCEWRMRQMGGSQSP